MLYAAVIETGDGWIWIVPETGETEHEPSLEGIRIRAIAHGYEPVEVSLENCDGKGEV